MRFFRSPLLMLAAAVGLASANPVNVNVARQESARFGLVSVSPSTVKFGETFTITYNSTTAEAQPVDLDVYLRPTLASGFVEPDYLLGRFSDYGNTTHALIFQSTLPILFTGPTNGYLNGSSYQIWAYITFINPDGGGALINSGTSTTIYVDLD